jgi:hypothetical protein
MNGRFYLLKIHLVDIEPVIWRRFVAPASITLDRLHDVIQIVMGWTDSHLHKFTIVKKRYRISAIKRERTGMREIPARGSAQTERSHLQLSL